MLLGGQIEEHELHTCSTHGKIKMHTKFWSRMVKRRESYEY